MTKELEDLEKQLILKDDMEQGDIKQLVGKILHFCKIDEKGFVVIQKHSLTIPLKIMLILSTRYLANKLQQKLGRENVITEEVSAKELSNMLKVKGAVILARLKELKDAKKILSTQRGIYKIASYAVRDFLNELEETNNE